MGTRSSISISTTSSSSPAVFLEIDGVPITVASNDGVHDFVIEIAPSDRTVEHITDGLGALAGASLRRTLQ